MKDYSNYHSANTNEKISHDGLLLLEHSLNGFEGNDVVINSTVNSKILIYQKWDAESETKKVIGRIEDIDRGNIFRIGELDWLVVTLPEDNKIYRKAEMKLCNSTFPIQSDKTQVLKGYNEFDEPIYEYTESPPENIPCIVEAKITSESVEEAINLPEGRLNVIIPFREHPDIVEGKQFTMYGSSYQIIGIDYTKSVNKKGILTLQGKKV